MPTLPHFSLRNRVRRRKRLVDLDAYGIRALKPDAVSELVGRHLAAAHARCVLAAAEPEDQGSDGSRERVAEPAA